MKISKKEEVINIDLEGALILDRSNNDRFIEIDSEIINKGNLIIENGEFDTFNNFKYKLEQPLKDNINQELAYLRDYLATNSKKINKLEKENNKGLVYQERVGINKGLILGINSLLNILKEYEIKQNVEKGENN